MEDPKKVPEALVDESENWMIEIAMVRKEKFVKVRELQQKLIEKDKKCLLDCISDLNKTRTSSGTSNEMKSFALPEDFHIEPYVPPRIDSDEMIKEITKLHTLYNNNRKHVNIPGGSIQR